MRIGRRPNFELDACQRHHQSATNEGRPLHDTRARPLEASQTHDMSSLVTNPIPSVGPPKSGKARIRLLIGLFPAVLRAGCKLILARLKFQGLTPPEIQDLNRLAARVGTAGNGTAESTAILIERVAYVIPRVANRLPWRADCLIQAMAAQRWLRTKGVATLISIGVHRPEDKSFSAHAWLKHGERIVTGGEISAFSPLFTPEDEKP